MAFTRPNGLRRGRVPLALGLALAALSFMIFGVRADPGAPATTTVPAGAPATLDIPYEAASIELDGFCREYASAATVSYDGPGGAVGQIYVRHSNKYLTLCIMAPEGAFERRYFSVYLDTDNEREAVAQAEDYALRIDVTTGDLSALVGTGQGGYEPGQLPGSFEAAVVDGSLSAFNFDSAEYRIPLPTFYTCQRPFGLAVYQHDAGGLNDDYGWPSTESYDDPGTWNEARLLDTDCTPRNIRICHESNNECTAAEEMALYRTTAAGETEALSLDQDGFVNAPQLVVNGDTLWGLTSIDPASVDAVVPPSRFFHTSEVVPVSEDAFDPDGLLTVATGPARPLAVQDLDVSAQWLVTGDPVYRDLLAERIRRASDYFYDFTNGQFMLGEIVVYQSGEQWEEADVRLYPSNINRPNSSIGGIVPALTPDIAPTNPISYVPGVLAMGKEWNRYMAAPGEEVVVGGAPIDPLSLLDDWSIALAHELGHYLLFLYDTYLDVEGNESQALADQCYGSAMGNPYIAVNQSFVWDIDHWGNGCGTTLAYAATAGRTEWQTIQGWYGWTVPPTGPQPLTPTAALTPPVSLTNVTFVAPATLPDQPLAASQLFELLYVDSETASYEARAFTFRDERIYDQGKPPAGLTQVQLTDGRLGDRLCVYDLNDHGEDELDEATPRYQFGCETIAPNDAALAMSKNEAWRPLIEARQLDATRVAISVVQELSDPVATITLRVYPEYKDGYPLVTMDRTGALHTHTVDFADFGDVVGPIFMQLWVEESMPAPQSARETVADRGTGGGGAFGAAWHGGGVLVISSDGHARFTPEGGRLLLPGESIAWQSMPGTPPLPADKRIVGQSYRLDAFPAELADAGTVALEFEAEPNPPAVARLLGGGDPVLHFYDGSAWQPLGTTVQALDDRTDGWQLAAAESAGVGIYALFYEQSAREIWLPLVQTP